jgi:hypothetical protein
LSHADFELATGSVIGRDHRLVQKNYQDGTCVIRRAECTIAVVTDGCGSSKHSEVGAQIGARIVAENISKEISTNGGNVNWRRVRFNTLVTLDMLAKQMGGRYQQTVMDYFLFTIVGVLLTDEQAVFFALGDGMVVINGVEMFLGDFPDNAPPYIGYGLIGDILRVPEMEHVPIGVVAELDLAELDHFLIGSDGVEDLIDSYELNKPGTKQPVGGIEQFWTEDVVFANPELINRRLKLIARDWPKQNPDPGLLPDDTTLVVGRRKQQPEPETAEEDSKNTEEV